MWSLLMHKNKKYCATIFGCSKSNVHQILRVQPQGLMSSVLHSSILWKDLPTFFGPGLTIFFLASWRPLSLWSKTQLCCSGNRCNWQKTKSHLQLPSSRWASSSLALHVQQRFRFFCVDISFPRTSFFDPFSCLLVSKSRELFPWAACSVSVFLHFESFVSPWTSRLTSCSLEITFPRSCFDSFRPEVCSLGIVDGTEALFSSTFSFLCNSPESARTSRRRATSVFHF